MGTSDNRRDIDLDSGMGRPRGIDRLRDWPATGAAAMTVTQSDAGFLRTLARGALVDVVSDKARLAGFCERMDWGLMDPKAGRNARSVAMKIYSDILQRCGVEGNQVTQQIFLSIGARDERDAMRKIAIVNEAEAKSPEQRLDGTAAWLNG